MSECVGTGHSDAGDPGLRQGFADFIALERPSDGSDRFDGDSEAGSIRCHVPALDQIE